jgi:glycerol-3-phosphate dehydrogenase (NAD(P)+)
MKVAIIGAGSLGLALTHLLITNKNQVNLFDTNPAQLEKAKHLRQLKKKYLHFASCIHECLADCDYLIPAIPSQHLGEFYQKHYREFPKKSQIISVTKGFYPQTTKTISQALNEYFHLKNIYVLSGPTFAGELIHQQPTACIIASNHQKAPKELHALFDNNYFRFQHSSNLIATELGGILKDCYAITLGLVASQGFPMNTLGLAVVKITQETSELYKNLLLAPESVYSLSFLGDLIATGLNRQSRNFQVGFTQKRQKNTTVEGLDNIKAALKLAASHKNKLPILAETLRVLKHQTKISQLFTLLLD